MLNILRFSHKYVKQHISQMILFGILSVVSWAGTLILPAITGKYIDLLLNIDKKTVYRYTKILIVIVIVKMITTYFKNISNVYLKNNIIFKVSYDILEYVKKANIQYFNNMDVTYLNQRINMDCSIITSFIIDNIIQIIINASTIIIVTILIIKLNFKVSIFLIFLIPINIIIYMVFKNKIFKTSYQLKESQNKFFASINEQLYNVKLIKINSWYDITGKFLKQKFKVLMNCILQSNRIQFLFNGCNSLIVDISNLILFFFGGFEVINGNLTIGEFAILNSYFLIILNNTSYFLSLGEVYQNVLVSYSRIEELLSLKQDFNGECRVSDIESITLKNLQFKYSDECDIIKNINYKFNRGNIYYILGENGSGKSTLIDLMLGLYPSYEGEIYYNDINIKEIDIEFIRKNLMSVTEQEPKLMNTTLIDNFTYGFSKYDLGYIEKYCKSLNIYDFIISLPNKFNFFIGDKSSKISGGEKQKISLIRSLIKKSNILILDEPTSALDKNSVNQLKDILQNIKTNKIIIIITHDNDLLDIADDVIELH